MRGKKVDAKIKTACLLLGGEGGSEQAEKALAGLSVVRAAGTKGEVLKVLQNICRRMSEKRPQRVS